MIEEEKIPSEKLHNEITRIITEALSWEAVVDVRQPVLDYLKECEKRDTVMPMSMFDGGISFGLAEDGEEEEFYSSERYPLADIISYGDDPQERYGWIKKAEAALIEAHQRFENDFGCKFADAEAKYDDADG